MNSRLADTFLMDGQERR